MIHYRNCLQLARHLAIKHWQAVRKGARPPILFTGGDFNIESMSPLIRDLSVSGAVHSAITNDGRLAFYFTETYDDMTYDEMCDDLEERLEHYTIK